MVTQKLLPHRQAVLLAGLVLFFCLPGLAQSHMTVRHDVHSGTCRGNEDQNLS